MSEQVKRYDAVHIRYEDNNIRYGEGCEVEVVTARDYDALEAEFERLRAQVSALQSDANSWQSGYDKGREDGAKAAEGWKAQHARDSAELRRLCAEREALSAELEAIKGQQPVAFYWQDIGYPEPRKHGPYFGWPSESALRNVDGGAIPVPLYTLPPATLSPEVQASGPYASVAGALAQRYPKPSLLKDCNVSYSNSSRPLAEQGERQEAVAWALANSADEIGGFAPIYYTKEGAISWANGRNIFPLYTTPQPSQDVRSLVEALEECAASLAWNCLGECRAIHAGPIMPAAMALDTARAALSTHRQAQPQ